MVSSLLPSHFILELLWVVPGGGEGLGPRLEGSDLLLIARSEDMEILVSSSRILRSHWPLDSAVLWEGAAWLGGESP